MVYQYRAYTLDKRIVRGTIDAASERLAEEALYRAGYHRVLKLSEARAGLSPAHSLPTFFGVKKQDVIDFSRQMAALMAAGVPIMTALRLLEEQSPSAALRKVIAGLARRIQEGSSFSQALEAYPQAFSVTYCQVMKTSELAGNFETALRRVADYLEKEVATFKKMQRALIYPAVVLLMAFGVTILLTTIVLPAMARLFTSLGGELPWTTRTLMAAGNFVIDEKAYILMALGAIIILIFCLMRLSAARHFMDGLALKLPVFGEIIIQRSLYRFCQSTAMLLRAGLPMPQIIGTVAGIINNAVIRQALGRVRSRLVQGQGLSAAMAETAVFPQLLVEMTVVGETTGTLDTTLTTMADLYEQRVEQKLQMLITMIEPALIIVVGLVVAFIAVSMVTPMYSILRTMT